MAQTRHTEEAVGRTAGGPPAEVREDVVDQPIGRQAEQRPASSRPRQLDDIPSVVRALLTGYDEA
jgi:hypothetical protein